MSIANLTTQQPITDPLSPTGFQIAKPEQGAIFPYVKSTQIFICPSNADGNKKLLSFTMNCAIAGANEAAITETSSVILLNDEALSNDGYFYADDTSNSTDQMTRVHNGGGNLLFSDGHAKYYQFSRFPVSKSLAGQALKIQQTGAPRFYDPGLGGSTGYFNGGTAFGTCVAP